MQRVIRLAFAALVAMVATAIVVQDFGGAVPEGLFNTGRSVARWVSLSSLAACVVALAILLLELKRGKPSVAGTLVRVTVAFVVTLELLVTAVDIGAMSRSASAPLGGPYYETRGQNGDWLVLGKHQGPSPFGFRTGEPYAPEPDACRVLFLGDSYTEGSGRRPECNYPTVVAAELSTRLGRRVEVMNAGVSGYGPSQALMLLRELVARGYRADAIVYNFLVENDFTDDLPGTSRRVVAGMGFRFPQSWFLRTFHPVNTRTFRTAMFLRALVRIRYELDDFSAVSDEPCDLTPQTLVEVPGTIRDIVTRKLSDATRVAASAPLRHGAVASVRAMQRVADSAGVPFVVVVFPDRATADPQIERLMDGHSEELQAARGLRNVMADSLAGVTVLDVSVALEERPGLYRAVDTHLSDLGNVVAGQWVAARLAALLEDE